MSDPLRTIDVRIPLPAAGPRGLEAVIVEPAAPGRYPLAIVNHGSPRSASDRPKMTARDMLPQLLQFARRGYVAVAVLRRGYGTSGGGWAESYGPCTHADYAAAGRAGAADIRAAIAWLAHRSEVEASKILAVGVSAGGFATDALTADPPPGLVAAISFAGGRGSQGPDNVCEEQALVDAFSAYGARSRVPMLWVYAANDHFFDPPLASKLLAAFKRGGGNVTFVAAPAFGSEGHYLFSPAGIPVWDPIVQKFLASRGLPATQLASLSPVPLAPPKGVGAKELADFQTFEAGVAHKAFAVGDRGGYAWRTNQSSTQAAIAAATANCKALTHGACHVYAVDDHLGM
jgi:dienelactone hydrolase